MRRKAEQNQHNNETCKIKTVGPANRIVLRKHKARKNNKKNQSNKKKKAMSANNDEKLEEQRNDVKSQQTTSRWRQTARLITNKVVFHHFIQHFRMIGVSSTQVSPKGTSHFTLQTRCHNVHAVKFQ